ncbi:MAG: sigma-70 family RNA polymerase sigma factor [Saprospiraceae bacterium]|nr:sigma-70 family RNA polymerase sigma factor [Saprospiraceae bacterium]
MDYEFWWSKIQHGNQDAFNDLFRALYPELKAYGMKIAPREDLVQDAIQKLFVKLWKRKDTLGQVKSVKSYILKGYRRTLIDLLAAEQRRARLTSPGEQAFHLSPEDLKIYHQEQEQQARQLSTLLSQLPEKQREIIYLRFYNQLSFQEIADILDINYQTARNYGSKAIRYLSEHWKPD